MIKSVVMSRPGTAANPRRSLSSSRSISSVDCRERSPFRDYESRRWRREERRDGDGSQEKAWVKREHELRRGSY